MITAKRTTCAVFLLALGVACAFALAMWPWILARWNVARLDHRDQVVREAAAETLGRLGLLETVPPLLEAVAAERVSPEAGARSLVLFGRPIVPALTEAVSDPRRPVRQAALEGILGIEPEERAPEAKLLRDLSTAGHDQRAIHELSRLDPPSTLAVLALAGMACDSTHRYHHFAADALGQIGPAAAAALPAILAVVADGGADQRGSVAMALAEIAPGDGRVVDALVRAHRDHVPAGSSDHVHTTLVDAIGKLGPAAQAAVPSLLRDLERGEGAVRWKAANVLGAIGPDAAGGHEVMAALVAALRSGDQGIVSSAADALLSFGAAAVPSLAETAALPLPHPSRWAAVQILGIIGSRAREAVPVLIELLDDPALKLDAVVALGGIGPAAGSAVPALLRLYRVEDDVTLSWHLSEALVRIGPAALGGLMRMLAEGDARLCLRALRTIAVMGSAEVGLTYLEACVRRGPEDSQDAAFDLHASLSVPTLIPVEEAEDPLRWHERRHLVLAKDSASGVGPAVTSALDSEDLVVRLMATRELWRRGEASDRRLSSIVARLFRERVTWIHFGRGPWYTAEDRHEAARVLAEMGPRGRDALPALERAIGDPEPTFRALAALALWKVGGDGRLEDVMRALLGAAADRHAPNGLLGRAAGSARPAVGQALGEIGPPAIPHILPRLDDPDEEVRMALVEGLGAMGPMAAPARTALVARLADEDFRVRRLAMEALERIGE